MISTNGQTQRIDLQDGSCAWWPCVIGARTMIGKSTSIGALAHIGADVRIGNHCKIQGSVYIADASMIGDHVFIGPSATILNDKYPPSGTREKWQPVQLNDRCVIGGNATILPGCIIGMNAVVGAGAVVTQNIPANEVWIGNPAKFHSNRHEYEAQREQI